MIIFTLKQLTLELHDVGTPRARSNQVFVLPSLLFFIPPSGHQKRMLPYIKTELHFATKKKVIV